MQTDQPRDDSATAWLTSSSWDGQGDDESGESTIAAMLNQRDAEARAKQSEMRRRSTQYKTQLKTSEICPNIQERMELEKKRLQAMVPMGFMGQGSVSTYLWDLGLMEHTDSFEREFPGSDGADKLRVSPRAPHARLPILYSQTHAAS